MNISAYNKAIVAFIMGIIAICNAVWPGAVGVDEGTVSTIVAVLTPLLVYAIPNKRVPLISTNS